MRCITQRVCGLPPEQQVGSSNLSGRTISPLASFGVWQKAPASLTPPKRTVPYNRSLHASHHHWLIAWSSGFRCALCGFAQLDSSRNAQRCERRSRGVSGRQTSDYHAHKLYSGYDRICRQRHLFWQGLPWLAVLVALDTLRTGGIWLAEGVVDSVSL